MTDLSPAAQAVWHAAWSNTEVRCGDIEGTRKLQIAAALRAAADQVVPGEFRRHSVPKDVWLERCDIRRQLRAIAAELDGATPPSENVIAHD
jgi:hypothetical protein